MSFWRDDVIGFALSQETGKHVDEQRAWILSEPDNPRPYFNLARLYLMEGRRADALGLLLECIRLDAAFAGAHVDLVRIYALHGDNRAAWRHARLAEAAGNGDGVDLLLRHGVTETNEAG